MRSNAQGCYRAHQVCALSRQLPRLRAITPPLVCAGVYEKTKPFGIRLGIFHSLVKLTNGKKLALALIDIIKYLIIKKYIKKSKVPTSMRIGITY